MSKHTPGPWTAERTCLDGFEYHVHSDLKLSGLYMWCPRMTVGIKPLHGSGCSGTLGRGEPIKPEFFEENRDNALVIAASPELLAACLLAREWMADEGFPSAKEVLLKLDAAIAKATGAV